MNILVIGAHRDDEILGAGGTINRFRREGYGVFVKVYSGRSNKIDQLFDTKPINYWITKIEKLVEKIKPAYVFTHHLYDLNRDHRTIAEATMVACRPKSGVRQIYCYEVLSSTELSITPFNPNTYVVLTKEDLLYKMDVMKIKYIDELMEFPHPRSIKCIESLATLRGSHIHENYAEAFVAIRIII